MTHGLFDHSAFPDVFCGKGNWGTKITSKFLMPKCFMDVGTGCLRQNACFFFSGFGGITLFVEGSPNQARRRS